MCTASTPHVRLVSKKSSKCYPLSLQAFRSKGKLLSCRHQAYQIHWSCAAATQLICILHRLSSGEIYLIATSMYCV